MDCARLSDAELVRLVRAGGEISSAALHELEQRHFPAVRAFASACTVSEAAAGELAAQAWAAATRQQEDGSASGAVRPHALASVLRTASRWAREGQQGQQNALNPELGTWLDETNGPVAPEDAADALNSRARRDLRNAYVQILQDGLQDEMQDGRTNQRTDERPGELPDDCGALLAQALLPWGGPEYAAARGTEEPEQDVGQEAPEGRTPGPLKPEPPVSGPPVSEALVSEALATALWTTGSPGTEAAAARKRRLAVFGAAGADPRTKGRRRADLFVRGAAVAGLCGIGAAVALSFAGADSRKGKPQSNASAPPVRPPSSPSSKAPAPSSTQTSASPAAKATETSVPPSKPSRERPVSPRVSPPADGTAVEWLFDEFAGAVTPDTSGNDKNGTLVGASGASTAAGGSLRFDGGQFVASDGPLVDTSSSFSVSARVKLNDTDSSQTVVSQDGAESSAFLLQYDAEESQWEMRIPEGPSDDVDADADEAVSDVEVEAGEWTHLTGVYDEAAGKVRLYVNGSPGESVDHEEDFASRGDFVVGRGLGENEYFRAVDGTVDDVRAFGKAVSPAEAKLLAERSS